MFLIDANSILILISSTLFLGYVSGLFYSRTKIPDIIWLLAFGILLGPVLNYFDSALFVTLSPMMSIVALCIILFDAGINVDVRAIMETMHKSVVLSFSTFAVTVVVVGYALYYLMPGDFTLLQAMLFGSMVGGTSTVTVLGILGGLEQMISDLGDVKIILMMESVISDPLCIVMAMTFIRMIMLPDVSFQDGVKDIFFTFAVSSLIGFGVGLAWAQVLNLLHRRPFNYIMTIAALFPTYIIAESVAGHGAGPVSALTFGLSLTNYQYLMRGLGGGGRVRVDKRKLREFHEEITFLIKSFFFVFIGLIVVLSEKFMIYGLLLVGILALIRFVVVTAVSSGLRFTRVESTLTKLIFANGLPALVMSQLPSIYDPQSQFFSNPEIYTNLCFPIVIGTVIFGALLGPILARSILKGK
jgi:cell volume regulation protein A